MTTLASSDMFDFNGCPYARLQRIDDVVDGSVSLLLEDATQSKVTGIHVRGAGESNVLQRTNIGIFLMQEVLHYLGSQRTWMNIIWFASQFRRRLGAHGAKPESNRRWKTGSGHVCLYVCMFFKDS